MNLTVVKYTSEWEKKWDSFISSESVNGTFLQSRHFLNYHPAGRFEDCSVLFCDGENIVALCPACIIYEDGNKVFSSHSGSTYGGLIVRKEILRTEKVLLLIEIFEEYLKQEGFKKCILKQQNPLMCTESMDLLEFVFYYKKYIEYKELDVYVDFDLVDEANIISGFSKLKKRQTKKCVEAQMQLMELNTEVQLSRLLEVLSSNLEKYGLKPYHTVRDLIDLKERFPEEIQYWGCLFEGRIVAISMVFVFEKARCAHTHYLAADPTYSKYSPMTYIYYKMVEIYKKKGLETLSWGITTEHLGVEINHNLTNTKEEFGSKHNVVSIYEKTF